MKLETLSCIEVLVEQETKIWKAKGDDDSGDEESDYGNYDDEDEDEDEDKDSEASDDSTNKKLLKKSESYGADWQETTAESELKLKIFFAADFNHKKDSWVMCVKSITL